MVVAVSKESNRVMVVTVTRGRNILHSEVHHEEMSRFPEMMSIVCSTYFWQEVSLANENDTEIYTDILL